MKACLGSMVRLSRAELLEIASGQTECWECEVETAGMLLALMEGRGEERFDGRSSPGRNKLWRRLRQSEDAKRNAVFNGLDGKDEDLLYRSRGVT